MVKFQQGLRSREMPRSGNKIPDLIGYTPGSTSALLFGLVVYKFYRTQGVDFIHGTSLGIGDQLT